MFCQKCDCWFGIKGTIFQVLFEAPYAILYHHGLELPEIIPNETLNDRVGASLPMHTMPDHLDNIGFEVTNCQKSYPRCIYGNGCVMESDRDIFENQDYYHNLAEAIQIDSFFSGDIKARHYNTTAMMFSIFDVMFHR